MEKIIANAVKASSVWNSLKTEEKKKLKKYFHLRPTNSGMTIISTLPQIPMRGISVTSKGQMEATLKLILENYKKLVSVDMKKAIEAIKHVGFKCKKTPKLGLEENVQAVMINTMTRDKNLTKELGCKNEIKFIASEVILERNKEGGRLDIVGYDGRDIYFFELKKDRTTDMKQLKRYLKYFESKRIKPVLEKLLANYPINSVPKYKNIIGVMVMRSSDNSKVDWRKLSGQSKVLFYTTSLSYCKA